MLFHKYNQTPTTLAVVFLHICNKVINKQKKSRALTWDLSFINLEFGNF